MEAEIRVLLGIGLKFGRDGLAHTRGQGASRQVSFQGVISPMIFCSLANSTVIETVFLEWFAPGQFLTYNKAAAFCYSKGIRLLFFIQERGEIAVALPLSWNKEIRENRQDKEG